MKKIALVTFHTALSCGAQLQAFAIQEAIKENGFDCRIIDFVPPMPVAGRQNSPLRRLNEEMSKMVFRRKIHRYHSRFANWISTHLQKTNPILSESQLKDESEKYDAFVCGSDQIWRMPQRGFYYLDFTPEQAFRIAYAPSFGNVNFDESSRKRIADYLRRFDYLSVRERDGAQFVSKLIGRAVPAVLDPTLLWTSEYWRNFSADPGGKLPKRFVLVFSIQDTLACLHAARKVCARLGIPPVFVDTARRLIWNPLIKNYFDVGPAEFLRLIELADFIVTSSFHGTAFAVNFGKPFLTICRNSAENVNSRIQTLADTLKAGDRLISPGEDVPESVFCELDPEIDTRLAEERLRCRHILTESLFLTNSEKKRNEITG